MFTLGANKMNKFLNLAIQEAKKGFSKKAGGPFGAVIVKNGKVIAKKYNTVLKDNDPTAHAEVNVIRKACKKLKNFDLTGCELYSTCEPCPMCLFAIHWAQIKKIYYGASADDATKIGFDDKYFYDEVKKSIGSRDIPMVQIAHKEALEVFKEWDEKEDKILY